MVDKLKKIWVEGEMVDWDDAKVHVLTHSLHYGVAAFEGIRAYKRTGSASGVGAGTHIFRLKEHIQRLADSCKMTLLTPRFTKEQIETACVELLRVNGLDEGYLRPLVFLGDGAMGVYAPNNPVRTSVIAWKWGSYLGEEALAKGIRCKISSFARHHVNISLAKGKITGQYTNSVLAKREAKLAGYDEAIMLDAQGYVSEGSGENLFIVKQGRAHHARPLELDPRRHHPRHGARSSRARRGSPCRRPALTRDQLWLADEAFFTGTAAELTPIREVDNRAIGEGGIGPITKRLQARFFDVVRGGDTAHPEWLTRV